MKTGWLRLKWLLLFCLAAFLIAPTTGLTQFGPGGGGWPGGGGGRGGRGGSMGGGMGGGGNRDPNERWMQYTGGAPVWQRSSITDPRTLQSFDRIASMVGSTNGEITKEQYLGM